MADVWQYFAKKYQLPYSKDRPLWPERRTLWPTSATFMRNWWIGKWFKHSKTVEYIFEKNWIDSERFQTTACPLKNTEQPQCHSVTVFILLQKISGHHHDYAKIQYCTDMSDLVKWPEWVMVRKWAHTVVEIWNVTDTNSLQYKTICCHISRSFWC